MDDPTQPLAKLSVPEDQVTVRQQLLWSSSSSSKLMLDAVAALCECVWQS